MVGSVVVAQATIADGPWWLELSRYLPYPLLLLPALAAFASTWLLRGPGWRVVGAAVLAGVVVGPMGWVWRFAGAPPRDARTIRVMTWNVKAQQASERDGGLAALAVEVFLQRPDVLAMQDANALKHLPPPLSIASVFGLPEVYAVGQFVVASRFPLRDCRPGPGDGGDGAETPSVTCRVEAPTGGFELTSVHLASPRMGLLATRREGLDGVDDWQRNRLLRHLQAEALAARLAATATPAPRLVVGDFNAAHASGVMRRVRAAGFVDAFAEAGRGFGFTYGHTLRPRFSFLRIDHVLASGFDVVDCSVGTATASDHRPVVADVRPSS